MTDCIFQIEGYVNNKHDDVSLSEDGVGDFVSGAGNGEEEDDTANEFGQVRTIVELVEAVDFPDEGSLDGEVHFDSHV